MPMPTDTELRQHNSEAEAEIERVLSRYDGLPAALLDRLRGDGRGDGKLYRHYSTPEQLPWCEANSSYAGTVCGCFTCRDTTLVEQGTVGVVRVDDEYMLLGPGYHSFPTCGCSIEGTHPLTLADRAITFGGAGFVTISVGRIGVLRTGATFRLLPPGTYYWSSPSVAFLQSVDITADFARLGPYTLLTVPDGHVAVTYHNGQLRVLGTTDLNSGERRAYFLDDPKWVLSGMLSLKVQTDRLESNDLLSKDNVELVMVAMAEWHIVDPVLAVTRCADSMNAIRENVNQLVRATIARIVAGTCISAGPVSGSVAAPVVMAQPVDGKPPVPHQQGQSQQPRGGDDEIGLARLMQSEQATHHMAELSANMSSMGINVVGVYVPEKRMKNDDIRREIAKQAVIGIKAEAERSAADASAYATVRAASAEAEAIAVLAKAHSEAGERLGGPQSTAARMALTEATSKALQGSKLTVFSGMPSNLPFLLNGDGNNAMQ